MTTEIGDPEGEGRPRRRQRRVWSQEQWDAPTRRRTRGDEVQYLRTVNASLQDYTSVLTRRVSRLELAMDKMQELVTEMRLAQQLITPSVSERGSSAFSRPFTES